MQFLVIAHDYKDENALKRRLAVREEHLKFAGEMFVSKNNNSENLLFLLYYFLMIQELSNGQ